MSIYGNLFINESNTFDLDSFNSLLEEDINFEVMFNEACTINILTEAIDMKTIKEKIKNAWDKIKAKIRELIQKIKDFIKYIKEKIIKIFCKKNKEKAEEICNKVKESDTKDLESDIIIFDHDTIYEEIKVSLDYCDKNFIHFNTTKLDISYEKNKDFFEKINNMIDDFIDSNIFASRELVDQIFEKDSKYTITLKTVDEANKWLNEHVKNGRMEKELANIVSYLDRRTRIFEDEIGVLNASIKMFSRYDATDKVKFYNEEIKITTKIINLTKILISVINTIISEYCGDCVKVMTIMNY